MHKLVIRPSTRDDIKKIWRYTYKNRGEQQAGFYTQSLGSTIDKMPENPEMGITVGALKRLSSEKS